jgi:hypothetical protein
MTEPFSPADILDIQRLIFIQSVVLAPHGHLRCITWNFVLLTLLCTAFHA